MTRKRFVKKLMAEGFSRNEANRIAFKRKEFGMSYREYYAYKCSWLRISIAMQKVGNSFENAAKTMSLMNSTIMSFNEAMCAVAQSN